MYGARLFLCCGLLVSAGQVGAETPYPHVYLNSDYIDAADADAAGSAMQPTVATDAELHARAQELATINCDTYENTLANLKSAQVASKPF